MKKIFLCVFLCLFAVSLSLFDADCVTKQVKSQDVNLEISERFIVFTPESEKKDFETIKGSDALVSAFENDNELLLIATTDGLQSQFFVRKTKTEFSKETKSLSGLTDETLKSIANQISNLDFNGVYTSGTTNYLRFSDKDAASSTVFITVENGYLYTFNFYGNDQFVAAELLSGVSIETKKEISPLSLKTTVMIIFVWIIIIAGAIFIVWLIISSVRDYKLEHNENDVSNYIKIKRRKF